MKRHMVLFFLLLNGLIITFCIVFYWMPSGRELTVHLSALDLQERRYEIKEQNRLGMESNKQILTKTQNALDDGEITLLRYSDLLPKISEIRKAAEQQDVTEISLYMEEPVLFDTQTKTIAIIEVSAAYSGEYQRLCGLLSNLIDSSYQIHELSISKNESIMNVAFTLYGIVE